MIHSAIMQTQAVQVAFMRQGTRTDAKAAGSSKDLMRSQGIFPRQGVRSAIAGGQFVFVRKVVLWADAVIQILLDRRVAKDPCNRQIHSLIVRYGRRRR